MAHPQGLGTVIPDLLKEFGLDKKARNYAVLTQWPELVGERVANVTRAEKLEHGILTISVKNPVWRYELTMQKTAILTKIELEFGKGIVRDIVWKL